MSGLRWRLAALVCMLLGLRLTAQAQTALSAKVAHLRAGPSRDYPVVAVLAHGSELAVQGCLPDYSWCDVVAGAQRGWMYAANISYAFEGAYVTLPDYGAQIGVAVLGFSLSDYWGSYYRDRPFYPDRDQWRNRPRPHRSPGAGLIRPVPGPIAPGAGPGMHRPQPPQRGAPEAPRTRPALPPVRIAPRPEPRERGGSIGEHPPAQQGVGR